MVTLKEARESTLRNIAGACSGSPEFLSLLNEATQRLMSRGDWEGTVARIQVCVTNGCLVFPRYVGSVRKMNVCGNEYPLRNIWWEFMPQNGYACGNGSFGLVNHGKTPVYADVRGTYKTIRAYADCRADIGKTVTIFGLDDNQQVLKTRNADGTWSEGIVITIAAQLSGVYGSTSSFVSHIDRVIKDSTNCAIRLYAYDTVNDVLDDLAYYEPGETMPEYERYQLKGCCDCTTTKRVDALVKLRYVPARVDNDLVLIDNLPALKDMMMSIKFSESGDTSSADKYEAKSIRELNLQLANMKPDDDFSARNNVFASTCTAKRRPF